MPTLVSPSRNTMPTSSVAATWCWPSGRSGPQHSTTQRCSRSPSTDPAGLIAEALDAVGTALPVLVDLDEELDVDAFGQLRPHPSAHLFQDGTVLADDHALLAVPLDDDLAPDPRPLPLGDAGRDAVRQLVVSDGQQ